MKKSIIAIVVSAGLLSACQNQVDAETVNTDVPNAVTQELQEAATIKTETIRFNAFLDKMFMDAVMRSPEYQTYLGIKKDYDKWDEDTEKQSRKDFIITKKTLDELQEFNIELLDTQAKISYQLAEQSLKNDINDYRWRHYNYPVNQMHGVHSNIPAFLINQHTVSSVSDAQAYISRLNGVKTRIDQLIDQLKIRVNKKIVAPRFVFPHVIRDSQNLISGAPFTEGDDSTLFADIKKKVNKLDIDDVQKQQLIADAEQALLTNVLPAYQNLLDYLIKLEPRSNDDAGVWKFRGGDEFYNNALQRTTTTTLTADEIHQLGLSEVSRIHDEMRAIKNKVGFKGSLAEFMQFMRTDKQFYYPNSAEGKQRYLDEATALIDNMKTRLDELFIVKPKAELVVKRVEAFREKSAGKAFYSRPSPDGTRPGMYYANLFDMEAMPTYQMEALAYHEGIPGHHMQLAISQELEGIPKFRKYKGYTAYSEGWGLYTEFLPKEIGLYSDPYSDFGRLAMELWRACRLVVDTGMHAQQWTRKQSIAYYMDNTPNALSDAVKMVERHAVMPSQATAYKIGMIKILELRAKAKNQLGDKFDIRQFHDVILKNGPLPLDVLETMVDNYIKQNS